MDQFDEMDGDAQQEHSEEMRAAAADAADSNQAAAGPDMPIPIPSSAAPPTRTERLSQRGNIAPDAEHRRKVLGLELQRERILSERTASPHRRSALGAALIDIEEKLSELGWTLHL